MRRRYVDGTLVLETEFETESGRVRLTDFMALPRDGTIDLVRIVTGLEGSVPMRLDVRFRFDYGRIVPWVRRADGATVAIAGPDALRLATPLELEGRGFSTVAEFTVKEGQSVPAVLTWFRSFDEPPRRHDAEALRDETVAAWRKWSKRCKAPEPWRDTIVRSAITLKALTHHKSGGIVAAATTSLPERIGGTRNWDYRFCWLRDATFTLYALMATGYTEEARRLAQMAGARGGRRAVQAADHVRLGRRAAARRIRGAVARRLRRQRAGAHRQCRAHPAPARRLWRDHGRAQRRAHPRTGG